MLRRTIPAVSFTPSHIALMFRSNKPLLGSEMTSTERFRAAWDDMPYFHPSGTKQDQFEWDWRALYEFGLRDNARLSKGRVVLNYCLLLVLGVYTVYIIQPLVYLVYYCETPDHLSREGGRAYAKRHYGVDVWCADGKFVRPYVHINPPMFTMTVDELE